MLVIRFVLFFVIFVVIRWLKRVGRLFSFICGRIIFCLWEIWILLWLNCFVRFVIIFI